MLSCDFMPSARILYCLFMRNMHNSDTPTPDDRQTNRGMSCTNASIVLVERRAFSSWKALFYKKTSSGFLHLLRPQLFSSLGVRQDLAQPFSVHDLGSWGVLDKAEVRAHVLCTYLPGLTHCLPD
jgi:hypothetical protein